MGAIFVCLFRMCGSWFVSTCGAVPSDASSAARVARQKWLVFPRRCIISERVHRHVYQTQWQREQDCIKHNGNENKTPKKKGHLHISKSTSSAICFNVSRASVLVNSLIVSLPSTKIHTAADLQTPPIGEWQQDLSQNLPAARRIGPPRRS
jgi:hypothetical protein